MTTEHKPTREQAIEVLRVRDLMMLEGFDVCVHWNRCGCCITVHEDVVNPRGGYIIGADGRSDWINLDEGTTNADTR